MSIDTTISPYYDDFDPSKKYTKLLAVPGRNLQGREFTQAQSTLLWIIKQLSSALMKEGDIIEGCSYRFSGTDNTTFNVDPGKIYMDGIVNDFSGGYITISGTGIEKVGVKLQQTIITENEDESLREPAWGTKNYGKPGMHRIKSEVVLTLDDASSVTIYELKDGLVQVSNEPPQLEIIERVLARRTFDESGNYKVKGLDMWVKDYDTNNVLLTIDAGKAYIQGFELAKPSPTTIVLPKAQTIRSIIDEPKVYATGTTLYLLNNYPTKTITAITAVVEVTQTITKGVNNGTDSLPNTPVVSITSVSQGGTTYIAGTDYQLTTDKVDWSLGGAEPASTTSYSVTYRYNKQLVLNTDFKLTISNDKSYLELLPAGTKPVDGTTMLVDYDFYLWRSDRVYMDSTGDIEVLQGQSDTQDLVQPPVDADLYRLCLGVVKLTPNSSSATVISDAITRVSMREIHTMLQRLDNLEYNQAIDDLDREAMVGEPPTDLKGILTDGFIGLTKSDVNHPLYSATIDVANFRLVLPATRTVYKPTVNGSNSTITRHDSDKYFTLPYSQQTLISQPLATTTMNVNPYQAFTDIPFMSIQPEKDSWIDEQTIVVNNQTVETEWIRSWSRNGYLDGRTRIENLGTTKTVNNNIIAYARQIDITIHGHGFPAGSDLLTGYIDDVKVNLTPLEDTLVGSQAGTVKSTDLGTIVCKFTIPTGTRTGFRNIKIKNPVTETSCVFYSMGTLETTTDTVYTRKIVTRVYDPLAQSFQLSEDHFVTGVDLYFKTKDMSSPATVQLRTMENGYPAAEVLAEVTLDPSIINISNDGTSVTSVTFPYPVLCEANTQYCISILTGSINYSMFVAQLGQKNLTSDDFVTGQAYVGGVLFSSSNAQTWTPHQDKDLKFNIRGAQFSTNAILQYNDVSSIDLDQVIANAEFISPAGTSCVWEFHTSTNGTWLPINPGTLTDLGQLATMVTVRARLSTSNDSMSPIISGDMFNIVGIKTKTSGTYVSKNVPLSQAFTVIKQVVEAYKPVDSTVDVQLSIDDGATWVSGILQSTEVVDDKFNRYTYEYTVSSGSPRSYRARINLSTLSRLSRPEVSKFLNILK